MTIESGSRIDEDYEDAELVEEPVADRWHWLPRWLRKSPPAPSTELVTWTKDDISPAPYVLPHSPARAWADKHTTGVGKPDARKVKAVAGYWARTAPQLIVVAVPKITRAVLREVLPVARGLGAVTEAFLEWKAAPTVAAAALTAEAANKKSDKLTHLHRVQTRRTWMTCILLASIAGGGVYLYFAHTIWLWVTLAAIVCLLDWIGRRGQPAKEFAPVKRQPLTDGMPLRQLTESILAVFAEEGLEVSAEGVIAWDAGRMQYRQGISTYSKITDEHLRALERGIGAKDLAIKKLGTDSATSQELVIQYGDPLTVVPPPPDYEPLSLTITHPLSMGVSVCPVPFELLFAGAHMAITASTGGAKTKVHMRNALNVLTACRDCAVAGIDLQNGPEFSLWRKAMWRRAFTPQEADELLDEIIEELYQRMKQLNIIAEADDESNDDNDDEWRAELGPYVVLLIDEFPVLADFNGKAGKLDLLGKVMLIHRLGRKVGISCIRAAQATGVQDGGTTVLHKQTAVNIVGPCDVMDTDAIFGPSKRKQGYTPHALKAADLLGNINDAGKCYIDAGGFGPDEYRGYAPLSTAEVKRRARRRGEAGLPTLGAAMLDVEAVTVPPGLSAVDAALRAYGNADKVPSALVLEHANKNGGKWTAATLVKAVADEAAAAGVPAPKPRGARSDLSGQESRNHWHAEDITRVVNAL